MPLVVPVSVLAAVTHLFLPLLRDLNEFSPVEKRFFFSIGNSVYGLTISTEMHSKISNF